MKQKRDLNAWRYLFLVNELNELQTTKLINTELNFFLYGLLMEGVGLKYWITHDPDLNLSDNNSPENYVLFYFVTVSVIFGCGVIQYCFKMLTSPCNALKTEEFCDLCSVSNISVMMFDYTHGGYYIHGRSPSGFTEVSAEKLRHQLLFESYGKSNMRGITYEDPDLQTYAIYIPTEMMKRYNHELK